ncbi:hypothetical protein Tco_0780417 [Tanacetum coccineum]
MVNKRRRKRDQSETEANAPPKVLRQYHASVRPEQNTRGGKSLAAMGLGADPPPSYTSATKDTSAALQSVSDPDPLSYAKPQPIPEQDIAQSSKKAAVAEDPESEKSTSFTSMGGSPGSIYQPGWGVTNNCRLDTPDVCQDIWGSHSYRRALLEAEADMKEAAEAKNAELVKELESLCVSRVGYQDGRCPSCLSCVESMETEASIFRCSFTLALPIPVYPEVRNPKDPWSFKEEILLEDAIAANISRAKKKKKCRVVCRTHGVGSAHHARSDGVPVSVPTAAPQGLSILLADAATQTEISEDEASLRLLRSKSLPPMYNLDWP